MKNIDFGHFGVKNVETLFLNLSSTQSKKRGCEAWISNIDSACMTASRNLDKKTFAMWKFQILTSTKWMKFWTKFHKNCLKLMRFWRLWTKTCLGNIDFDGFDKNASATSQCRQRGSPEAKPGRWGFCTHRMCSQMLRRSNNFYLKIESTNLIWNNEVDNNNLTTIFPICKIINFGQMNFFFDPQPRSRKNYWWAQ